jgi:hypothetical protein
VSGFSSRRHGFASSVPVQVELVVDSVALGQAFVGFPRQYYSIGDPCSFTYRPAVDSWPVSGRSAIERRPERVVAAEQYRGMIVRGFGLQAFVNSRTAYTCWLTLWTEANLRIQSVPERKHFIITKINFLMQFKEIIDVCGENHTKPISTECP